MNDKKLRNVVRNHTQTGFYNMQQLSIFKERMDQRKAIQLQNVTET